METEKEVGNEELETPESTESTPAAEPTEEPTEAELAKAALEATEPEKPKEDMVPATVVATQRAARRAAELEAAELRGRLAAQEKVSEKSPLELAAEEQDKPLDEIIVDGKLLREQRAWDKKQTDATTHQQKVDDFKMAAAEAHRTMTDEVHGAGLGLSSLQELGAHLIDDLDEQRIFRAGRDCGKAARKILLRRILEAGGANAQELKNRIKTHKDSQVKPKEKPGKPEPKVPSAEEVVESDAFLENVFEGL